MASSIENYRNMVEQPWGKMFYDLIFRQLDISNDKRLKILDCGAGFCITSDHYAGEHDVTALEPEEEMRKLRVHNHDYALIPEGVEYLKKVESHSFDLVICHNVLEYVDNVQEVLTQFKRVLKPRGMLSIVKHNEPGKVMAYAVLNDNPKAALDLLSKEDAEDSAFGQRNLYDDSRLSEFLSDEMTLVKTCGIRTFFGLSSNNDVKFTDEWYNSMFELELKTCAMEEFQKVAFYHHLIYKKTKA